MWAIATVLGLAAGLSLLGHATGNKSEEELRELEDRSQQGGPGYQASRGFWYFLVILGKGTGVLP
jgi:hypothetical protein